MNLSIFLTFLIIINSKLTVPDMVASENSAMNAAVVTDTVTAETAIQSLPLSETKDSANNTCDIPELEITDTVDFEWPEIDGLLGTLSSSDLGISDMKLYWSHDQKYVDRENSGILSYLSNPPGDLSGHSVVADHNYQLGQSFARAKSGDQITITTKDGEFTYQYIGKEYGVLQKDVTYYSAETLEERGFLAQGIYADNILMDSGKYVFSSQQKRNGDLFVFTCYPLDALNTNKRLVIEFKMVKGVELVKD